MIYNQSRVLFDLPDLESAGSSPARDKAFGRRMVPFVFSLYGTGQTP